MAPISIPYIHLLLAMTELAGLFLVVIFIFRYKHQLVLNSWLFSKKSCMLSRCALCWDTMASFWIFCPKSISNLDTNEWEIRKYKGINVKSTIKIDIKKCLYFYRCFTLWCPNYEICFNYFSDRNSQKQLCWEMKHNLLCSVQTSFSSFIHSILNA